MNDATSVNPAAPHAELLRRARAMIPTLADRADAAAQAGRISAHTIADTRIGTFGVSQGVDAAEVRMQYETDAGAAVPLTDTAAGPNDALSPRVADAADAAVWKVAEAAQHAGQQAREAAGTIASSANEIAKGLITQQITAGCQWIGQMAESTKGAARSLEKDFPEFAGLLRQASDKVESFSKDLPDRSMDDVYRSVADFHRQQPVVLFGAAAVVGFFAYRLFKSNAPQAGNGAADP